MPGARDAFVLHESLVERPMRMRANIARRVELSVHVVDADDIVLDFDATPLAGQEVAGFSCMNFCWHYAESSWSIFA